MPNHCTQTYTCMLNISCFVSIPLKMLWAKIGNPNDMRWGRIARSLRCHKPWVSRYDYPSRRLENFCGIFMHLVSTWGSALGLFFVHKHCFMLNINQFPLNSQHDYSFHKPQKLLVSLVNKEIKNHAKNLDTVKSARCL